MPAFSTALAALASLSVVGVAHNYAVDAVPEHLSRAQLPALLILLDDRAQQQRRLLGERGGAFQAAAFAGGERTVAYTVTHLLLTASAEGERRRTLPVMAGLLDAYFAALALDVTLGGALAEPARVTMETGTFEHGGASFYGCALRHQWIITYAGSSP